jgi:mRNA interferase MazF
VKRGELWTAAGGPDYASKPRPVLIIQEDRFDQNDSATICPLTSDPSDFPLFRILIEPSPLNGLRLPSRVMADKVSTVSRTKLRNQIGRLTDADMTRVDRALLIFLGLAR